ncbi:MAG: D-2-hydroxyacid dehydrogenase [Chloroflexota bacterium]
MNKVNVLILHRPRLTSSQEIMKPVAAGGPRISVRDGTDLFATEIEKSGKKGMLNELFLREAKETSGGQSQEQGGSLDALLAEAEVVFGLLRFPERLLARAPKLKWIHIGGVGIDIYRTSGIFDGSVTVTNSRGAIAIDIAEHVLAFIMMLAKGLPRLMQLKQGRQWEPFETLEVRSKTVGIIGLGAIGSEVVKLTKAIGMNVIGTRRSATKRETNVSGMDELYPLSELNSLLARSDFVVIAAPLTTATTHLIDEARLKMMKRSAYLVNIARGGLVDEKALIRALKEGWIAGAGLDVFEREPLSTDSELWQIPNAILSPHMSGFADTHGKRVIGLFCDNLKRYLDGQTLMNILDKNKEY